MALTQATQKVVSSNPGIVQWTKTFDQLITAGSTDHIHVPGATNHVFQVTVAAINTNVIVEASGSNDGTSFGVMTLDSTAVTGISGIANNRATITANGTYLLNVRNTPTPYTRFTFVSETGGSAATIDVKYLGSE